MSTGEVWSGDQKEGEYVMNAELPRGGDGDLTLSSHSSSAAPSGETLAENFEARHLGSDEAGIQKMLASLSTPERNFSTLDAFTDAVVPEAIRLKGEFKLKFFQEAQSEFQAVARLREIASKNKVFRSFIGTGYYDTITPPVIQRNILENPGWYTQYTPYQPEISQGRLEALLNFQTMVTDLTGLDVANASLLDEGTAAAEAMGLSLSKVAGSSADPNAAFRYYIADTCHPQTIAVVKTRAEALGVEVVVSSPQSWNIESREGGATAVGMLLQYPDTEGSIQDWRSLIAQAHTAGMVVCMATDLLALTLLTSPGELGADIAVGSAQRFGVPFGFGGPHAAFFAVKDDLKRQIPGRLVGVSKDVAGRPALRLSLQTREQHIRREKATSNICTAQVLLAIMASMYAVYHGPKGIRRIAQRIAGLASDFASLLRSKGAKVVHEAFFDTLKIVPPSGISTEEVQKRAAAKKINLRDFGDGSFGVSLDEKTSEETIVSLMEVLCGSADVVFSKASRAVNTEKWPTALRRTSNFLTHKVFNQYHTETEFLRYLKRLESKDLSLAQSMIPLGSCTMKLNATSEMLGVTWPEFGGIHPFAPAEQCRGYLELFKELEQGLKEVTGFAAVSLQPNSGAQGEYAGLLVIREYLKSANQTHRKVCLIPKSAHGTNPASAVMAGFDVVVVECDSLGNVDLKDLKVKIAAHADKIAALMVTYPSTHGVFETQIKKICKLVHDAGGQVYMDGANLNAQVGLCRPNDIGADVCHINLHKTFCIPHGGGGPGMGPIAVKKHLAPFLPNHPLVDLGHESGVGPVSAGPWGSSSILVIPWVYMRAMGALGLKRATQIAILNANYIARRLETHYPVLYRGESGFVAHECILDLRDLKRTAGVEVEDVAKRLMDYGFHAPTVSWPVAGTLMIEPTESESHAELDRFCDAMISIREEVRRIEEGKLDRVNNPLKNAPHTAHVIASDSWERPYSRELAAFPAPWTREYKFWPSVGRIDAVYGDKNLVCTCAPLESYQ